MLGCGRGGVKEVAALADYGDAASRNRQQRRVLHVANDLGPQRRVVQGDRHRRWNGMKHRITVERFSAAWLS